MCHHKNNFLLIKSRNRKFGITIDLHIIQIVHVVLPEDSKYKILQ
jgi:hypothetical protein